MRPPDTNNESSTHTGRWQARSHRRHEHCRSEQAAANDTLSVHAPLSTKQLHPKAHPRSAGRPVTETGFPFPDYIMPLASSSVVNPSLHRANKPCPVALSSSKKLGILSRASLAREARPYEFPAVCFSPGRERKTGETAREGCPRSANKTGLHMDRVLGVVTTDFSFTCVRWAPEAHDFRPLTGQTRLLNRRANQASKRSRNVFVYSKPRKSLKQL